MSKKLASLLAVAVALGTAPAAARAERPDSDAPAGAPTDWLPHEEWVMERWMPFDTDRLSAIIGLNRTDIYFYLRGTDAHKSDKTILDLARNRGIPTKSLVSRLLSRRRRSVTSAQLKVLR